MNRKFLRFRAGKADRKIGSGYRGFDAGGMAVYDVLFLDGSHGGKVLARGLDHDDACACARSEAQRRGVGRMFLAGSELGPVADMVVIVESARRAA
jgi:hypothetical protein